MPFVLERGAWHAAIKSSSLRRHFRAAPALRASGGEAAISEGGTSAHPAAKLLTEPSQMASPAEMARLCGPEPPVPEWWIGLPVPIAGAMIRI